MLSLPHGGLANRISNVVSTLVLGAVLNRSVYVHWPRTTCSEAESRGECDPAGLLDLYDAQAIVAPDDMISISKAEKWPKISSYKYGSSEHALSEADLTTEHAFGRLAKWLDGSKGLVVNTEHAFVAMIACRPASLLPGWAWYTFARFEAKWLPPAPVVVQMVLGALRDGGCSLGVHVRVDIQEDYNAACEVLAARKPGWTTVVLPRANPEYDKRPDLVVTVEEAEHSCQRARESYAKLAAPLMSTISAHLSAECGAGGDTQRCKRVGIFVAADPSAVAQHIKREIQASVASYAGRGARWIQVNAGPDQSTRRSLEGLQQALAENHVLSRCEALVRTDYWSSFFGMAMARRAFLAEQSIVPVPGMPVAPLAQHSWRLVQAPFDPARDLAAVPPILVANNTQRYTWGEPPSNKFKACAAYMLKPEALATDEADFTPQCPAAPAKVAPKSANRSQLTEDASQIHSQMSHLDYAVVNW